MSATVRFLFGVALLIGLVACDPAYPLFLRNGLATPITVQTTFQGSAPSEGVLQPGQTLTFLHPQGEIEHVVVLSEGRKLHDLTRQALLDMRNSVSDPRQVTWNIQADGIKPLSRAEIEGLEKK
ncbi:MAG: hypothetical protein IRZ06_11190 [Nevskia sp.]|nr:hypothetical protein [Nevskia sp.]